SPVLLAPDEGRALAWRGDLTVYKALGTETADSYCLLWTRVPPDAGSSPYVQTRADEGFYVLSGELTVTAGNRTARLDAGGFVNVLKAGGDETHGAYALWDFLVPGGGGPPPHVHHREDECFFVLEGSLAFYVGHERRRVTVPAGGFLNAPRDVPHFFRNEGAAPVRAVVVAAPAGLEKYFAAAGRLLPDAATPAPQPTPQDLERLLKLAPQFGL